MRNSAMHLLVVLAACCALASSASSGARQMLQKSASAGSSATSVAMGGGTAEATSEAMSFGGTAFAEAFASTEVVETSANIFVTVTNEIVDKTEEDIGNCTLITEVAEAAVTAQGEAVAAVYVEAFGTVEVDGEGSACAESAAAGEATASAFADATGVAIVEALGDKAQAGSEAVVQAVAAGTASAFANAFEETCTTGGFGEASQTAFGKAIVRPMVEVYALALGGTSCQDEAAAAAEALAIGEGSSMVEDEATAGTTSTTTATGNTTATTGGDAGATTDVAETVEEQNAIKASNAERCRAPFSTCCTRLFREKDECTCSLGKTKRCDAKKIATSDDGKATWEDAAASKVCKCA